MYVYTANLLFFQAVVNVLPKSLTCDGAYIGYVLDNCHQNLLGCYQN